MKREQIRGFIIGLLVAALVFSLGIPAFAAYQKQATLDYNEIRITLDGKAITPTDANGGVVEPFAVDGTTYLPVRAIANALGLNVEWNGDTKTVVLRSDSGTPPQTSTYPTATLTSRREIEEYVEEHYTSVDTAIGAATFTVVVSENKGETFPEDYMIWLQMDREFYTLFNRNDITADAKESAKETLSTFMETLANDLINKLPGKKLEGYYLYSYWLYPNIKEEYRSYQAFTWKNYYYPDGASKTYYTALIGDFTWCPDKDTVSWK